MRQKPAAEATAISKIRKKVSLIENLYIFHYLSLLEYGIINIFPLIQLAYI